MNSSQELINIEKQINLVKNNAEYKRLSITQRAPFDDRRFKEYVLQLNALELRKSNVATMKDNKYTPNGRPLSVKKPTARIIPEQKKDEPTQDPRVEAEQKKDKPKLRPKPKVQKPPKMKKDPAKKIEDIDEIDAF